jgi:hypothetical protein
VHGGLICTASVVVAGEGSQARRVPFQTGTKQCTHTWWIIYEQKKWSCVWAEPYKTMSSGGEERPKAKHGLGRRRCYSRDMEQGVESSLQPTSSWHGGQFLYVLQSTQSNKHSPGRTLHAMAVLRLRWLGVGPAEKPLREAQSTKRPCTKAYCSELKKKRTVPVLSRAWVLNQSVFLPTQLMVAWRWEW